MTSTANQPRIAPLNRLAGESAPNTLGGMSQPRGGSPLRRPWAQTISLTGAALAALAFVLLMWRPA